MEKKLKLKIRENEADPIFTITDLLPHLAQDQMEKKLKNGVEGEDLNLLIGSIINHSHVEKKEEGETIKNNVM